MRSVAVLVGACAVLLAACTSSGGGVPTSTVTQTQSVIGTHTTTPSIGPTAPVPTGPTTAARAAACPLLPKQQAADRVGMRLDRITVLHSGGTVVGCRFYALQGSPLSHSEHLPGPDQPAIEIETVRYVSPIAAHNAFVRLARTGANPQRADISVDNIGVCFQTAFYQPDNGRDWACAFSVGTLAVIVRTVVVKPALNVVQVSRAVARQL
ncbi:MAG: hypothetical protein ACRDVG_10975 [Jatrophihabitantaceae bacterium]